MNPLPTPTRYTFGDDDPALLRLRLVAEAYEPTTRAFVAAAVPAGAESVVDLGCGPGFSTALLRSACRPRRLVGVDTSSAFIDVARRRVPTADFVVHDASVTPLPGAPADVLYARLLLAHLPDPPSVAHRWQAELGAGGLLLVEDLEDVDAPSGPLRDYEELSTEVVRSAGGSMYAGRSLAVLGGSLAEVRVPVALAARIYTFNVERWLRALPPPAQGARLWLLRDGLRELTAAASGKVTWIVRQVAVGSA